MKENLWKLVGGIILLAVGAAISYFVIRPSPLAFARCEPLQGVAALRVRCVNESNYYRHVIWDLGEQGSPKIKDRDVVGHKYESAGRYTITLTAHGYGTPDKWTQLIEVVVSTAIANPIRATVVATTKASQVVILKAFQVNRTKDDHPSIFTYHSQTYTESFYADPGFKIVDAKFQAFSAARAVDLKQVIAPDGSKVNFSYRLTSGPKVDRYRGWLRGNLVVKQEQLEPAQNVTLGSELNISSYGKYALPASVTPESIKTLSILSNDGDTLVIGAPDGVLVAEERNLAFSLEMAEGQLYLKVEKKL